MQLTNLTRLFAIVLLAGTMSACISEGHHHKNLEAQAKLSKAEAQTIALQKVPGGKIKEGELEEEKGKLIWSFDIATEGTHDITEVNIDANSGEVIAVDHETAKDEAKEAKEEAKEKKKKKHHKDDDDDDEKDEKK